MPIDENIPVSGPIQPMKIVLSSPMASSGTTCWQCSVVRFTQTLSMQAAGAPSAAVMHSCEVVHSTTTGGSHTPSALQVWSGKPASTQS